MTSLSNAHLKGIIAYVVVYINISVLKRVMMYQMVKFFCITNKHSLVNFVINNQLSENVSETGIKRSANLIIWYFVNNLFWDTLLSTM